MIEIKKEVAQSTCAFTIFFGEQNKRKKISTLLKNHKNSVLFWREFTLIDIIIHKKELCLTGYILATAQIFNTNEKLRNLFAVSNNVAFEKINCLQFFKLKCAKCKFP